ncbi:MAG: hypothetical protein K9M11_04550 [Candidatus Pacebacteria bacterium]|nr:hypothetical protein [Candidatus Paceibacterota bacterium]
MEKLLQNLKAKVIEKSKNPDFIHHAWFVDFHLLFVEKLAMELCDIYKEADKDIVFALVWIHDYAKILDKSREHEAEMLERSRELMMEIGFPVEFINKILEYLEIFESKMTVDLNIAPIEVKIASSSDAASHLVGPFYSIYFWENPGKTVPELVQSNRNKLIKDWNRKVVLPEVRKAFESKHSFMMEQTADFPDKYFS